MKENAIRLLDRQFAKYLAERSALSGEENQLFQDLVCRLSMSLAAGDSCLPLSSTEEALVHRSGLSAEGAQPLCIFHGHLYLQRLFQYEKQLAGKIRKMAAESVELAADPLFVESLFAGRDKSDLQYIAAKQALRKNFLIISGGPGTGKTTTVLKILALLHNASERPLRIALAAPTGKAAMRLRESIDGGVKKLRLTESTKGRLAAEPSTLHRLLGVKRYSPFFRHNEENPLPFDVLVVDEASMVDLALMSKVVDALRPGSRLILLGDKNQLASVESGTVLADMMTALPDNRVELQKSYRFDEDIKRFAGAIKDGDAEGAWRMLRAQRPAHISLLREDVAAFGGKIYGRYMEAVSVAKDMGQYKQLFSMLHSFKILCAMRNGPAGVSGINAMVEQFLVEAGHDCMQSEWYSGRPVMVTRNEYALDLYNGDMGICLVDPEQPDTMKVWFERPDGCLQGILPGRIGSCETVYALTIHKSQGAEIAEVLVVLPEKESALVTRELLYTAVTRASGSVKIKADHSAFQRAVDGRIRRYGGLAKLMLAPLQGGRGAGAVTPETIAKI